MLEGERDGIDGIDGIDAADGAGVAASSSRPHERGGPAARAARSLALSALARWRVGRLTVHLPDGSVHTGGAGDAQPHSTLWIARDRFFRSLLLRGDVGVGDAYVAGDWRTDDLVRFLELGIHNQEALPLVTLLSKIANLPNDIRHWLRPNTPPGSRRNIRSHYDLSNDFFSLFLDPTMTYSAAVFASADEPLAAAQARKFRRFGDRLQLSAGDHVLEIGCGWGAFARFAARTYGCRVTGITISESQHAFATARVREEGLEDRVEIRLADYRDLRGRFDKIVSIEMLEAVGRQHWPAFFETCDDVLAPGGTIGIQTIAMPDHRFGDYVRHADWIQKHIFPGGLLPSLSEICQALLRRTRLGVVHLEEIGQHYARTLLHWRAAFLENQPAVRALGFDDRFVRMWEYYLASCEAMFRTRMLWNYQLVLGRAR